jgi:ferredoxin
MVSTPTNLYELLGVQKEARQDEVKSAYRSKLKISHPDVAGEASSELMMLLNDAYRVLSDPGQRSSYDRTLTKRKPSKPKVEISTDLGPTWKRSRDPMKSEPTWRGTPRSTSYYDKLPYEDRGEMWEEQKFVYVNPFDCVGCYQCFNAAPKTFMMHNVHGKALCYNQWGDAEIEIHWAIDACPVDCISWVSREDLQNLEHVTAQVLYDNNNEMGCAMQIRQGTAARGRGSDPFTMADEWATKVKRQAERAKLTSAGDATAAADTLERRIEKVFQAMGHELKLLGWPHYALPSGGR